MVKLMFNDGLDWLRHEEPASGLIRTALFAAIYDEHGCEDAVRHLLEAYRAQRAADDEDLAPLPCRSGDAASELMLEHYRAVLKPLLRRGRLALDEEAIDDSFEWPSSLPTDAPIPEGVLRAVAARMAAATAHLGRALRRQYGEPLVDSRESA